MSSDRERILARVRDAIAGRVRPDHPGAFRGERPPRADGDPGGAPPAAVDGFVEAFLAAGGEVVRLVDDAAGAAWLARLATAFTGAAVGGSVPEPLRPRLPETPARSAALGVSMARVAVAETGTLILDARDGRLAQLLPPVHLVFVRSGDVHATLGGALASVRHDLPSALGLHSGPSRSADIGQIVVRGVHGPGRVIAAILDGAR
jgi:L-lactate dehydrogenase complex protein LldG